jgi:protoporphyrinogen oxidase
VSGADFLILGAGPAGLAAAHLLAKRGFEVTVLERAGRVGGLAGSFEVAGQRVDYGSHRLHPATSPDMLELLRSLLGDRLQQRVRNGRIRLNGRWLRFPLNPVDLLRGMAPGMAVRAAASAGVAMVRPRRDATFADYVTTGLGRVAGNTFYFPYARKIWGVEPEELSGEQARKRISADSPWKVLRRVTAPRNDSRRFFYYPASGFGAISEALADAAVASGVTLRLGTDVKRLSFADDRVALVAGGGEHFAASRLWSTVPVSRLAQLAGHEPRTLEHRAMVLVYTAVSSRQYTPFDAHDFPEADVPMTRVSEPKNYRDGDDPSGLTVLCAEIPCSVGDEIWSAGDDDLGQVVADSLASQGLPPVRGVETVVRRLPHAYPIYRLGYETALDDVLAWAARQPGLLTLGRQGLFTHDNTHHALSMAQAACNAVGPDGSFDTSRWNRSLLEFQSHVVED